MKIVNIMDDPKDWKYRLEFNEKQQNFHLELLNKSNGVYEENTFGWVTIFQAGEDSYLTAFINYVERRHKDKYITVNMVRKELKFYKWFLHNLPIPYLLENEPKLKYSNVETNGR